jgi:ribosome-associated protein
MAGKLALSKRGFDVRILKLKSLSSVCDYFVIASGSADVQVRAIASAIEDGMEEAGFYATHKEGVADGHWVVLDYFDVVVHIFHEPIRRFYGLERLWGDAPCEELTDD